MFSRRRFLRVFDKISDPVERRIAPLLQGLLLVLIFGIALAIISNVIAFGAIALSLRGLGPNAILLLILVGCLVLLRRGHVRFALRIVIVALLVGGSLDLVGRGLANGAQSLLVMFLPIAMAGLFLGRKSLVLTVLVALGVVGVVAAGSDPATMTNATTSTIVQFFVVTTIFAGMVDVYRESLRLSLDTALTQARALERMQIDNFKLYDSAETERERLQVTLSSIGDAVITTDAEARITFLNPIAASLTGWGADEAIGQPLTAVFNIANEETGAPVENPLARVLTEGITVGLANHTVIVRRDGTRIPIADSGAPIRGARGRILGAVLVFRDVSDERRAQIALEDSELRFRSMADSAPVLIWMADPSKACVYFNQVWLDFTGRTLEQESGYGWAERVHPDDYEFCLKTYNEAFDARQPFTMDYRLRRHDGEYCWFVDNGVPRFAADGTFLGFIGCCIDITERHRHELHAQYLQRITSRLAKTLTPPQVAEVVMEQVMTLLGGHLGTLYVVSADGSSLELLNAKGGHGDAQTNYRTLRLDAPGPLLDAIRERQPVWIGTADEYIRRYPMFEEVIRRNGSQAIASLPLIVNDQVIGGISFSFLDPMDFDEPLRRFIDSVAQQCAQALDRARLYQIESEARQQAEEANLLKLQFLAMISHELRTPLTSIKGFTSTLLASDVDWEPEIQREFLEILERESDKLTEMVEQLLDVTRLQAGNLSIEPGTYALAKVVEAAKEPLSSLTHGFQFTVDVPHDLPEVQLDDRRVTQVLTNLISNATKYAPAGSEIALRARVDGDALRVMVSDEGIGIPPQEREAVFAAFHQLQHRRSGAGLGLAICKGLIEAHGGKIWIEDREAPGTTVAFTLPLNHRVGTGSAAAG